MVWGIGSNLTLVSDGLGNWVLPWQSKSKFRGSCRHRRSTAVQLPSTLVVEFFGPLVERDTLGASVHDAESSDAELFAGLHQRSRPAALLLELLSSLVCFLGHHLATLVDHQVGFHEPSLGELAATIPNLAHGAGLHLFRDTLRLLCLGPSNSAL